MRRSASARRSTPTLSRMQQRLVLAREFELCVSITDLAPRSEGPTSSPVPDATLMAVFGKLGLHIDLASLRHEYDSAPTGGGDLHVFKSIDESVVAVDLYRDPTDQLDLVCIYLRTTEQHADATAVLLTQFFSAAKVQVQFSRSSISIRLREALDSARYPQMLPGAAHPQRYVEHNAAQLLAAADGFAAR